MLRDFTEEMAESQHLQKLPSKDNLSFTLPKDSSISIVKDISDPSRLITVSETTRVN